MPLVLGIDVAGIKKGFHAATASTDSNQILATYSHLPLQEMVEVAKSTQDLAVIAVDAPPKAQLTTSQTRLSERQLHKLGLKVQWTRRSHLPPQEWMLHGQALWDELKSALPNTPIIETFPTAVARDLTNCPLQFPLHFCQGDPTYRTGYKDLLDASLAAWVALKFLNNTANSVGHDPDTQETDELGPIYF